MLHSGNDKFPRKKKLNYSNSFRTHNGEKSNETFRRDDELRHSTNSVKGYHVVTGKPQVGKSLRQPLGSGTEGGPEVYLPKASMVNGQRAGLCDSPMSDKEDISHSVSHLIKGFESKTEYHSHYESNSFLRPNFGSYEESLEGDVPEKHKRSASKRKLSMRKKGKGNSDANVTVLQRLGIAPFMGSENRNAKKALAHFDVQSVLFDIENASVLKAVYEDGGNRTRNISTGASAASMRKQKRNAAANGSSDSRPESIVDEGDGTSNELVESCPYFRNEIGTVQKKDNEKKEKLFSKFNGSVSARIWPSVSKNKTSSLELLYTTDNDIEAVFGGSVPINDLDHNANITLLEFLNDDSLISLWDRPKHSEEKRVFEFEHVDLGAMYYKNYFLGKEHQNYMGIDEKYGPICVSIIRENVLKMAVLGHLKQPVKGGTNKYQYRIILRTTDLQTFRGTVLEDSIPSTSRHGTSRALPARDILEFCFPELQISCLKTAITGPKVPEHLLKLDEQQLSLQFKVGLLYCKAGQKSEEDMYNNEHHGPAFDEFMDVIGEKVFLKGFEGYRAQLDNKNDSTGLYSLYTKFHNREIMFHVSTLLPWTPNNKQQLLRKRHIGNDIVTVIFQEPGAQPFTPKNIRSHFQHVFIIVRVENAGGNNATYKVAVSRSQDVPEFGPPIPPDSEFRSNKAFRDFLLSKIINAENAAHKSEKFTAMAVRTRYEYLKDLATNFVTTQGIDSGGAKFSKFNPMSLSVKKREKIHPPCSPEVWCQASLIWSVKVDVDNESISKLCYMAISTSIIAFISKVEKEIVAVIPCKSVIGWRNSGYSMRLYYNNGQALNLVLVEDDGNEITFVINRLKAVTPGCQTQDMALRRSENGQLGFHVFYEGLVAEVEPYGMAWQAGLRKSSRLLEINNRLVGKMSHDRMIQALRKPGSTRVVVLPPLPDGQPRNYKSTRNLKRYSSMTSVYSERLPESSDSSAPSSSVENLQGELDIVTPIRVGGEKMTVVEAIVKQTSFKNRSNNNHMARPYGFVLDSDQSFELPDAPSEENLISSSRELNGIQKVDGKDRESKVQTKEGRVIPKTGNSPELFHGNKPRKLHGMHDKNPKFPVAENIDPELTELEKTISDTRKSIDAKFYKSLVQSSIGNGNTDLSNQSQDVSGSSWPSLLAQKSSEIRDDNCPGTLKGEGQSSPEHSETSKSSTTSLNRIRSPPPYDEAITSLERRRVKKLGTREGNQKSGTINETSIKGESRPLLNPGTPAIALVDDKPRFLGRNLSSERKKYRYQVKSENLEDLLGMKSSDSPPNRELYTPPYEFLGNRNKLIARSESNIPSSTDQFSTVSDSDEHHRNINIVHTRVRDVNDVIKEKIHVRSGSADQLDGGSSLSTTPRRSSSIDESQKSGFGRNLPKLMMRKTSREDGVKKMPYSTHDDRKIRSRENIASFHDNELPASGTHSPVWGMFQTPSASFPSLTREDQSLNDTFAKIDQAFGFTSYITDQTDVGDKRDRQSQQKSIRSTSRNDTSDEDNVSSSASSLNAYNRSAIRRRFIKPPGETKVSSQSSLEKKKSEAEESLEAAITEFHSTLSNLPTKDTKDPVQSDNPYSDVKSVSRDESRYHSSIPISNETPRVNTADLKKEKTILHDSEKSEKDSRKNTLTPGHHYFTEGKGVRNASRQKSLDSPFFSSRGSGGRVQELVGRFSQKERKGSLDSSAVRNSPARCRSRSEARISLFASPSPWVRKDPNPDGFKFSEASSIIRRYEKHRESHNEKAKQLTEQAERNTPLRKKISVTVRPKLDMEKGLETSNASYVASNSPTWSDACERGMTTLPGRGTKVQKSFNRNVVDMSLSVRGLDLAPQRAEELSTSSKEDLRLMLSVLSGELIKEKSENERLLEELEMERTEKRQLMEQSKRSESQLRKFTSWFYDSVSNKDAAPVD